MSRDFAQQVDVPAVFGGAPVRSPAERLIFGAPVIGDPEIASVTECLRSGWIGTGPLVERFQSEFANYKGVPHAAAVSSGTAALHVTLTALGIGAGDEVIAPTMTFCSTIHAIVRTGATPILVDCHPENFNMNLQSIEERITTRTKAILVVHMCGRCCDMDPILEIARRRGLRVVEDCAHAIEAKYHGRPAGTMGDAGCFSFYATKNATTGDGGMVITANTKLWRKVKLLSLHGMDSDAWTRFSGAPRGYQVTEAGFKYNMTDISAALGLPQLAAVEQRWRAREALWHQYLALLSSLPFSLPPAPEPDSRHAYHLFSVLVQAKTLGATRDDLIEALRVENIGAGIHYVPVHEQPYYRGRYGFSPSDFPNALSVGQRTISLPISAGMASRDVSDVCHALTRLVQHYAKNSADKPAIIRCAAAGTLN
jgi:dTDP-4-amino-4,6-dideoxygalactose transaminase